jgi:hypothetical protein
MGLKRSKDYGKKNMERKEPIASLRRFIKACRQFEVEDRELLGDDASTAGECLFGCGRTTTKGGTTRWSPEAAKMLDAFLVEMKEWGL